MPGREYEEFHKVFDAESESCDWSDEWSAVHGHDIRVGRPNKAKLLAIRKRLAAWGREHFAPFAGYLRQDLQLSESSVKQTISRLTVATYETANRPWMKLRDSLLSWSYTELLHTDLRKLAAWILLDSDELEDKIRAWVEEMVEALLSDGHWNGGSRFQLLERYSVKPKPIKREVVRSVPGGAPEPEEEVEAPPAEKPTRQHPTAAAAAPRSESMPASEPTSPESLPEVLVIDEVARLIGVGRNKAYDLFRNGELPGGQRIGSRLIRFGRDAVLERVGIPIPETGPALPDTLRMDGLADLLRVHPKTLYQLIHDGAVSLPDRAWITHRPAVFSRCAVLEWLGGKGRDHGSSKDET